MGITSGGVVEGDPSPTTGVVDTVGVLVASPVVPEPVSPPAPAPPTAPFPASGVEVVVDVTDPLPGGTGIEELLMSGGAEESVVVDTVEVLEGVSVSGGEDDTVLVGISMGGVVVGTSIPPDPPATVPSIGAVLEEVVVVGTVVVTEEVGMVVSGISVDEVDDAAEDPGSVDVVVLELGRVFVAEPVLEGIDVSGGTGGGSVAGVEETPPAAPPLAPSTPLSPGVEDGAPVSTGNVEETVELGLGSPDGDELGKSVADVELVFSAGVVEESLGEVVFDEPLPGVVVGEDDVVASVFPAPVVLPAPAPPTTPFPTSPEESPVGVEVVVETGAVEEVVEASPPEESVVEVPSVAGVVVGIGSIISGGI